MKKIKSITVGIPVYNEEQNIKALLKSILRQKLDDIILEEIIVYSDASTDDTIKEIGKVKNRKITLLKGGVRKGKAFGLNKIMSSAKGDVLVIVDGDVIIEKSDFILTLINPILNKKTDLTSADLEELNPETFIEKALFVSMKVKKEFTKDWKNGDNVYNCHGTARAFSKDLYNNFKFKESDGEDMYSYFVAKSMGKKFNFVPEAEVKYRLPKTFSDHSLQAVRFNKSIKLWSEEFGSWIKDEFKFSVRLWIVGLLRSGKWIIRYPLHSIYYVFMLSFIKIKSLLFQTRKDTWNVRSSKALN